MKPIDNLTEAAKVAAKFSHPNDPKDQVRPLESPPPQAMPLYHQGTDFVAKTGPAVLERGEAVISKENNPMAGVYDKVPGMAEHKPKKVVDHMRVRKATSGGHIVEHHHTHPAHHKMEEHIMTNMDQLKNHMADNAPQMAGGDEAAAAGAPGASAGMAPAPEAPPGM